MFGLTPDDAAFERHIKALDERLEVYDQILSKQKYIAGEVRASSFLITPIFSH